MWVVYVIQNTISKEIYIGLTGNLDRRLKQHNKRQNKSTKRNDGEWILVYAEAFRSKTDAQSREKRLKHHGKALYEVKRRAKKSIIGG